MKQNYTNIKILVLLISILSYSNCSSLSQPEKPNKITQGDFAYLEKEAEYLTKKSKKDTDTKGVSILVFNDKEVLFQKGYGTYKEDKQVDENTIFKVGSVSKIFTALGIMKLMEKGKLKLDDPLSKHIPEVKFTPRYPESKEPTIRQMLTHHSGIISDYFNGFFLDENMKEEEYKKEFLNLPEKLKGEHLAQKPDEIMSYSNLSFSLLGVIIERISGQELESFFKKEIFSPLEMNSTSFLDSPLPKENISNGYYSGIFFGHKEKPPTIIRDLSAGSLSTSAKDMQNFFRMIFSGGKYKNKAIFKDSTLKEMMKKQNNNTPLDFNFSIGLPFWLSKTEKGNIILGHGGDLPPYHATLQFSLEHKVGVLLMSNSNNLNSMVLSNLAERILDTAIETKTGERKKSIVLNTTPVKEPKELLEKAKGKYVTPNGIIEVIPYEDKAGIDLTGIVKLYPMENNSFKPELKLLGFIPLPVAGLDKIRIHFDEFKGEKCANISVNKNSAITLTEFKPVKVLDNWKEKVGKYEAIETNSNYKPIYKYLTIEYDKKEDILYFIPELIYDPIYSDSSAALKMILLTEKESTAYIAGKGRNMGEPVHIAKENGEEYILF
ncbi:MAG: beta-lactamase family protein, partial [Leptospiraceae bacterium]|nr:beta-lactamase family protein [Leptospiraceae bacterium]